MFYVPHMNDFIQFCPLSSDLFSLSIIFSRSIHVVTNEEKKRKRKKKSLDFSGTVHKNGDRMLNQTCKASALMKLLLYQISELENILETVWVYVMGKETRDDRLKPEFGVTIQSVTHNLYNLEQVYVTAKRE